VILFRIREKGSKKQARQPFCASFVLILRGELTTIRE
jgi:hypothetical protein